jgi:hypothetical protein
MVPGSVPGFSQSLPCGYGKPDTLLFSIGFKSAGVGLRVCVAVYSGRGVSVGGAAVSVGTTVVVLGEQDVKRTTARNGRYIAFFMGILSYPSFSNAASGGGIPFFCMNGRRQYHSTIINYVVVNKQNNVCFIGEFPLSSGYATDAEEVKRAPYNNSITYHC